MSIADFEEFVTSVGSGDWSRKKDVVDIMTRVTVLGGGDDACMFAALALASGRDVILFSAYGKELEALRTSKSITLRGDGPIGSFHVDQAIKTSIRTTAALDEAVFEAEIILLTGPIHKQRTYAMVLADHLSDGQILVLPNARSLGAVELAWLLKTGGCSADITIIEVGGLPFWMIPAGGTLNLSACPPVSAACLPSGREAAIAQLVDWFPNAQSVLSCVHSGFADASAVVEIPALILGGSALPDGKPSILEGGVSLPENTTFRTLIGLAHEALIARLWSERCKIAESFGVRGLPSCAESITQVAGARKGSGTRPVPAPEEALELIQAGVIGSLIPLVSAADLIGKDVPVTRALITISMSLLQRDLVGAGRRLDRIGVTACDVVEARQQFDAILNGGVHG